MSIKYASFAEMSGYGPCSRQQKKLLRWLDAVLDVLSRVYDEDCGDVELHQKEELRLTRFWRHYPRIEQAVRWIVADIESQGDGPVYVAGDLISTHCEYVRAILNTSKDFIVKTCDKFGLDGEAIADATCIMTDLLDECGDNGAVEFPDEPSMDVYTICGEPDPPLEQDEHDTLSAAGQVIRELEVRLQMVNDTGDRSDIDTNEVATIPTRHQQPSSPRGTNVDKLKVLLCELYLDPAAQSQLDKDMPWMALANSVMKGAAARDRTHAATERAIRFWRRYPDLLKYIHTEGSAVPDHQIVASCMGASFAVEMARTVIMRECEDRGIDSTAIVATDDIRASRLDTDGIFICINGHWGEWPRFEASYRDGRPALLSDDDCAIIKSAADVLARLHAHLDAEAVKEGGLEAKPVMTDTANVQQEFLPYDVVRRKWAAGGKLAFVLSESNTDPKQKPVSQEELVCTYNMVIHAIRTAEYAIEDLPRAWSESISKNAGIPEQQPVMEFYTRADKYARTLCDTRVELCRVLDSILDAVRISTADTLQVKCIHGISVSTQIESAHVHIYAFAEVLRNYVPPSPEPDFAVEDYVDLFAEMVKKIEEFPQQDWHQMQEELKVEFCKTAAKCFPAAALVLREQDESIDDAEPGTDREVGGDGQPADNSDASRPKTPAGSDQKRDWEPKKGIAAYVALRVLWQHEAFYQANRMSSSDVARKANNNGGGDPIAFKKACGKLKKKGLADSVSDGGPSGGYWLTDKGKALAERLFKPETK